MRSSITIESHSDYSPIGDMAFSANWTDETYRYHVWLGLRPDVEDKRPPYPVKIGETIYKNTIAESRTFNTKKLDINAAAHAGIKSEIKKLATEELLVSMFNSRKDAQRAFDMMHAEADRLNRIFDAYWTLFAADTDTKEMMYAHAQRAHLNY